MKRRAPTVVLWIFTVFEGLSMAGAGSAKFTRADLWTRWIVDLGFPAWLSPVIGILEVIGAVGLFVPRLAAGAATLLMAIMAVALVSLLTHEHQLSWRQPAIHMMLLAVIIWVRLSRRRPGQA